MIAVDSSVAVAAFGEWHRLNLSARAVLDEGAALPAHALLETYSVLTGFPPPHRAAPALVDAWLDDRFPEVLPPPPQGEQRALVRTLASAGRTGGAVYDALVALTARLAGAVLVTADTRAAATYDLVGVELRRLDDTPLPDAD
ncbi:MAG: PIN domain-containing protein [Actinomycetota bacterium]|nr:PIN domain-containing protein [Euzebyales bacterium]MDQ3529854.1 PIN domain-containing protein [Actinomycetota bacterium]